ncbi:MAG TPA: hypothetical protein VHB47_22255 [Thermoanaerobaculia bacterium]|jgi:hypothetical protein|nr:hypothetical protein [Thermoanaerobaculia bacterium]
MSNGYERAQGQRNLLERLGAKIPGYRGFQDRELRRDVDKLQREHLAAELGRLKALLSSRARDYTDAGQLAALAAFGRLDRQLDGLQQTIRFSDYGASGLFDPVKINEPELERLYAFDLGIVEDVGAVEQAIAAVPAPTGNAGPGAAAAKDDAGTAGNAGTGGGAGGAGGAGAALDRVRDLVHVLDDKWRQRRQVISQAVQSAQPV